MSQHALSNNSARTFTLRASLLVAAFVTCLLGSASPALAQDSPTIITQPNGLSVCEGDAVTFEVEASGTGVLEYQWYIDGVVIIPGTAAELHMNKVNPSFSGEYVVRITNEAGSVMSQPATLHVAPRPVVSSPPLDQFACLGDRVELAVTVDSPTPMSFQWQKDGIDIPGAHDHSFVIDPFSSDDPGAYRLIIVNDCGATFTTPATVGLMEAPTVSADPLSLTVCEGAQATFTVTADGTPPLHYQWFRDGQEVPGATDDILSISAVDGADAGQYRCSVSNLCGVALSGNAELETPAAPAITVGPEDVFTCLGSDVTLSVTATGSEPLHYQWRKNGSDLPGANDPDLTIDPVTGSDDGDYDVVVSNDCGTVVSEFAAVQVALGPQVASPPRDVTVCSGDTVHLDVSATGEGVLQYQWHLDGMPLTGATQALLIFNAQPIHSGAYHVDITDDCGTTSSAPAIITVDTRPVVTAGPVDLVACLDEPATFSLDHEERSPTTVQWRKNKVAIAGAVGNELTIPTVSASDAGDYDALITNDCGYTISPTATLSVRTPVAYLEQPLGATVCAGLPVLLSATATGSPPLTYQWTKDGVPIPGATNPLLELPSADASTAGTYQLITTNTCGSAPSAFAVVEALEPPTIVAQPTSLDTCVGDAIALTAQATGHEPLTYQWYENGNPIAGADESTWEIESIDESHAALYHVVVSNDCGEATSTTAQITVDPLPAIVESPIGGVVCEGADITLTVTASGPSSLHYQWQRDGVDLAGETSPQLNIVAATSQDAADYTIRVTNDCGRSVSATASVTLERAPTIVSTPPPTLTLCVGEPFALSAVATGFGTLSYDWRVDGSSLGANESTLIVETVTAEDAGFYDVVIANDCGSVITATTEVIVIQPPTIDAASVSVEGLAATFEAQASGHLSLQWDFGDGTISDTPFHEYEMPGTYTVVLTATNECQSATTTLEVEITAAEFLRGDVDGDGVVTPLFDTLFLLEWAFFASVEPSCQDAADVDGDGHLSPLLDASFLLRFGFIGDTAPPAPGAFECGLDPEGDHDGVTCELGSCT